MAAAYMIAGQTGGAALSPFRTITGIHRDVAEWTRLCAGTAAAASIFVEVKRLGRHQEAAEERAYDAALESGYCSGCDIRYLRMVADSLGDKLNPRDSVNEFVCGHIVGVGIHSG